MSKKITAIILSSVLVVGITIGGLIFVNRQQGKFNLIQTEDVLDAHTEEQLNYLKGDCFTVNDDINGKSEKSKPEGITLSWEAYKGKEDIKGYRLEIADNRSYAQSEIVNLTKDQTSFTIDDLFVQTKYYWRVTVLGEKKELAIKESTFLTGGAPRNLNVEGITNVRDLGGWLREDGTTVGQGLIYRTGRLNKSDTNTLQTEITQAGIDYMVNRLGMRSEIDLRGRKTNTPDETGGLNGKSVLGDSVNYYLVKMDYDSTLENKPDEIKQVFNILADYDNYPLFFHCNIGTDRTGIIAFLIEAIMGVADEDMYRDYMFSNFANIGDKRSHSALAKHINEISYYSGDTLCEKAENYLIEYCGVSKQAIQEIQDILSTENKGTVYPTVQQTRSDLKVQVVKTPLGKEAINLDSLANVVAWRRYARDNVTEKEGTEKYIPKEVDGTLSLTNFSSNYGYRNDSQKKVYGVQINGSINAYTADFQEGDFSLFVTVDENTDKIILYVGALDSVTTISVSDIENNYIASARFASAGTNCKSVYKIEFLIDASKEEPLIINFFHPATQNRTYIAGIAITNK